MKKGNYFKQFNAIIISLLIILLNFSIAFNLALPFTKAELYGWCLETVNGKTCQPDTAASDCKQPYHSVFQQRPSECREVTCVLPDGNCQENVPYKTCIEELNGNPATQGAPQCNVGCCGIAGRSYGIMTEAECKKLASEKGFDVSYVEFYGGLTDERECSLKFAGKDRGCCVLGAGDCSYGYREECGANFFKDTYCYQILECNVQSHFKLGCGIMNGDENKICWFDSSGNQEECIESCDYPAYICEVNNQDGYKLRQGEVGYFDNDGNGKIDAGDNYTEGDELPIFAPYCKSTTCYLEDANGSQILKWENGGLKIEWKNPPTQLPSGHSICYNFYTVEDKSSDLWKKDGIEFPARSTGLQNQILRCINGRIEIDRLGPDRNLLCFENKQEISTYTEENKWQECGKCGKGGNGIVETIGDFFRAGQQGMVGFGSILGALGEECTPDACKNYGSFQNGESYCVWRSETEGSHGYGFGFYPIDTACMPRYPPGRTDTCSHCGNLGDPLFDFCEKQEAYAIGDCQLQPYGQVKGILLYLFYAYMITWSTKFNLIPWYTMIDSLLICIAEAGPGFWACWPGKWGYLIGEELQGFIIGPVKDIFKTGQGILSFIKQTVLQGVINGIMQQIGKLK